MELKTVDVITTGSNDIQVNVVEVFADTIVPASRRYRRYTYLGGMKPPLTGSIRYSSIFVQDVLGNGWLIDVMVLPEVAVWVEDWQSPNTSEFPGW